MILLFTDRDLPACSVPQDGRPVLRGEAISLLMMLLFTDRDLPAGAVPQDGRPVLRGEGQGAAGARGAPQDGRVPGPGHRQPRGQARHVQAGRGRQDKLQRPWRRGRSHIQCLHSFWAFIQWCSSLNRDP